MPTPDAPTTMRQEPNMPSLTTSTLSTATSVILEMNTLG